MKKTLAIAAIALSAVTTGCAINGFSGSLYSDVKGPIQATDNDGKCPKRGEASATSVLGLISTGDASVEAAKADGNIKEVISVDFHNNNILGLYATTTAIVCGR